MKLIDTHSHIYYDKYKDDLNYSDEAIRNLEVTGIISSLKIEN